MIKRWLRLDQARAARNRRLPAAAAAAVQEAANRALDRGRRAGAHLNGPEAYRAIDVRGQDEFDGPLGHIPGACNVPLPELQPRLGELSARARTPIVLVCKTDSRSARAAAELDAAGLRRFRVAWGHGAVARDRYARGSSGWPASSGGLGENGVSPADWRATCIGKGQSRHCRCKAAPAGKFWSHALRHVQRHSPPGPPILAHKDHAAAAVSTPENLLREATEGTSPIARAAGVRARS
jgi:rhodanese-related sulfurtransferase